MQSPRYPIDAATERGATLMVTLFLLMGIAIISIAAARTSVMQLRMASNAEAQSSTFQTAISAIDYTIEDPALLPTVGPLYEPAAVALTGPAFYANAGDIVDAAAARIEDCGAPPRARNATSLSAYSSFTYEITADIDRTDSGLGRSAVRHGLVLLGPKC